MSETEEDRHYYQAAEAAFIRRRGTPFLLSPRDFAQLREWRALGVPLEAIEQGIDEAFSRREDASSMPCSIASSGTPRARHSLSCAKSRGERRKGVPRRRMKAASAAW